MKKIVVSKFDEFKCFLESYDGNQTVRVIVCDGFSADALQMIVLYNSSQYKNKLILSVRFRIVAENDFQVFLNTFCDGKTFTAKPEFQSIEVFFQLYFSNQSNSSLLWTYQNDIFQKVSGSFKSMNAKVYGIERAIDIKVLDQTVPQFKDLIRYYNVDIFQNYKDGCILLNVGTPSKNAFDMSILHNNLLICSKFQNICGGFILNIQYWDSFRIKPYVQNVISEKICVVCNGLVLEPDVESIGKLPPAIFFREEDIRFFSNPLPKNIWKIIKDSTPIDFKTSFGNSLEKKYWPYFRMCQKFLFEEFENNESAAYTKIRIKAYSGLDDAFYNHFVSKISFMSLCLFAIYDSFYRNDLLEQTKELFRRSKESIELEEADLLLSRQSEQKWEKYKIYIENKDKFDIKNLLDIDSVNINATVTAEIFECVSISEGLLQILENAVKHAGGGLLSMRIYSLAVSLNTKEIKNKHHAEYLFQTYTKEYFQYSNATFYLELKISDLSGKPIPIKFCENYCKPYKANKTFLDVFGNKNKSMDFFFKKNTDHTIKAFRHLFYDNPENLVHHYGLEIFTNILTVRNGLFSVCGYKNYDHLNGLQSNGHGYIYDNLDDVFDKVFEQEYIQANLLSEEYQKMILEKIDDYKDKAKKRIRSKWYENDDISGTTYSILFPLRHSAADMKDFYKLDSTNERQPSFKIQNLQMMTIQASEFAGCGHGQKNDNIIHIDSVSKHLEKCGDFFLFQHGKEPDMVCINFFDFANHRTYAFENVIKGIILYSLLRVKEFQNNDSIFPIAIVNITSFQIVEAARIIAIYYAKETDRNTNPFVRMPLYLKCAGDCKEVVFSGKDIDDVKKNIIKTAMVNGTMFDELATIIEIFRKEAN